MLYQAKLPVPFGMLGIRCTSNALVGASFLSSDESPQEPDSSFAKRVCKQLLDYLEDPAFHFSIPIELRGTPHQLKVWKALLRIPRGSTRSYGSLATELKSCAQAIGQACGANPIVIIVPCHRVIAKSGLGGFMHQGSGAPLDIKRWLLAHEKL